MAVTRIYEVRGMTCDHCKQAVAEAAKSVDGVRDVQVDLKAGKISVTFTRTVQDEAIKEAINEAGYEVVV